MALPKITVDGSLKGQVKVDDEHSSTNASTLNPGEQVLNFQK